MKYILYGIIFIYLFRKIFGFVAKYYLTKFVSKQTQQFRNQQKQQKPQYPEGHIHVDMNPKTKTQKSSKKTDDEGFAEYEVIN